MRARQCVIALSLASASLAVSAAPSQAVPTGALVLTAAGPTTPVVTGVKGNTIQIVNLSGADHTFQSVVATVPNSFTVKAEDTTMAVPPPGLYQDLTVGAAYVAFATTP